MVEALAFDMFGTLFDVGALQKVAEPIIEEPEEFVALWRSKQLEYVFLLALMGRFVTFSDITRMALRYAARKLDVRLEPDQVQPFMRAWEELPAYPDAVPALKTLRTRHVLVVLSNGEVALLGKLLRHAGLEPFFSHVLSAETVRTYKPSPSVYGLAVAQLGLPPKEIGLVSSNTFDVLGAKAAGLKAFWVNRSAAILDPLDLQPDLEAHDLQDFVNRLDARIEG